MSKKRVFAWCCLAATAGNVLAEDVAELDPNRKPSAYSHVVADASECVAREFYCPENDPPTCASNCDGCGEQAEFGNEFRKPVGAEHIEGTCEWRALFSCDFVGYDVTATVVWFIVAGFAMAAGVGGGGIYVPLGILIVQLQTKQATGLSQACIFGGSLAGYIINSRARHPLADRPVIDFDMALFLAPMEMAGAVVGVMVQQVLPEIIVICLMAIILGYTAVHTLKKGVTTLKKQLAENRKNKEMKTVEPARRKIQKQKKDANGSKSTPKAKESKDSSSSKIAAKDAANGQDSAPSPVDLDRGTSKRSRQVSAMEKGGDGGLKAEDVHPELERTADDMEKIVDDGGSVSSVGSETEDSLELFLAQDAAFPWRKIAYLGIMWSIVIVLTVVKGGKGAKGLVEKCSLGYWLLTFGALIFMATFGLVMGWRAVKRSQRKEAVGYPFVEGDIIWTWKKFEFYSRWTFIAGILAGLIGIGGGMVLGPLMYSFKIQFNLVLTVFRNAIRHQSSP